MCVCSLGVRHFHSINTLRNLPGFLPSLLYFFFIFFNTAAKHSYLHGEDSQLLGGQLLHLLGQDLSLLQDGKLTLGITISTGENREHEYESPGKSQQASARAAEFIPESAAFARRPTRRFPRCPPRHYGCVCVCVSAGLVSSEREVESTRGGHPKKKTSRKTTFTTLQGKVREPTLPGAKHHHFLQRATPRLPEKAPEKKVDPCAEKWFGWDFW